MPKPLGRIETLLLSEGEVDKLEAWQKQLPADLMPLGQESVEQRNLRLKRIAARRLKETGIKLRRKNKAPITKELILANIIKDENGCWNWTKGSDTHGYGTASHYGKVRRVHIIAWELWNDKKVPDGLECMHSCDNPKCCSPYHITPGTERENHLDAVSKGRKIMKISDNDVISILNDCRKYSEIAVQYGVSKQLVYRIKRGTSRKPALTMVRQCA